MARSFVQQQSSFGGRRGSMPVQYVLQATNLEKLQEVLPQFMAKVYENPVFQMADVDLKFSKPEARIRINRDKASVMGVSTKNIAQTLQYGLSGQRMGYFYMNGKQYEILGEINRQQRNKPADLKAIYIRSNNGDMIQLDNLIELENGIAPPKLYRYNRFVSATISAGLADGKTIGQGLDEMDKIAKETLDDTFRTALSGDSKEYRESSSSIKTLTTRDRRLPLRKNPKSQKNQRNPKHHRHQIHRIKQTVQKRAITRTFTDCLHYY